MKYVTKKAIDWERLFREQEISPCDIAPLLGKSRASVYAYITRKYLKLSTIRALVKKYPKLKNYIIKEE